MSIYMLYLENLLIIEVLFSTWLYSIHLYSSTNLVSMLFLILIFFTKNDIQRCYIGIYLNYLLIITFLELMVIIFIPFSLIKPYFLLSIFSIILGGSKIYVLSKYLDSNIIV